ncbi:MAG: TetR/AcrR family transcriptional regulator [Pseudomonadota bacterium]
MKTKSANAIQSKQRILDVAARLFRDHGYAAVSLRAIAKDAEMKAGSLYYHFSSKEDLVVEILEQGISRVHDEVSAAVSDVVVARGDSDGHQVLLTAIAAHLRSLLRQSDYTSANVRIFGQVPATVKLRSMATRAKYEGLWDDLLDQLCKDSGRRLPKDKIRLTRLFVLGALNATLEWFDPKRGSIDGIARSYADIVWLGLGTPSARVVENGK